MIDKTIVTNFFKKRGYEVEKIDETGRSYVGNITRADQTFFFKHTKQSADSIMLENEAAWYKQANLISRHLTVYVPELIESGKNVESAWLVRQFFSEEDRIADAERGWLVPNFAKDYLTQTIDFLLKLPKLTVVLPADRSLPNSTDPELDYYPKSAKLGVKEAIKQVTLRYATDSDYDATKLIKIIDEAKLEKTVLAYNDFKPWHLYRYQDKTALIDAEGVNHLSPQYYDIASYYARMITLLNRQDLASQILYGYESAQTDRPYFWLEFRATLGSIAVGEIRDAKRAGRLTTVGEKLVTQVLSGHFPDA